MPAGDQSWSIGHRTASWFISLHTKEISCTALFARFGVNSYTFHFKFRQILELWYYFIFYSFIVSFRPMRAKSCATYETDYIGLIMGGHANLLIKPQISNTFIVVNWFVLFWVQWRSHWWPGQLPPNIVFASLSSCPSVSLDHVTCVLILFWDLGAIYYKSLTYLLTYLTGPSMSCRYIRLSQVRRLAVVRPQLSRRRLSSNVDNMVRQWQDLRVLRRQSLRGNECRPEELAQNITNEHRYMP